MAINLKSYPFDGPHGQTGFLQARSGVYAILGKHPWEQQYRVLDIGESQSVQERVANHDRAPYWRRHNVPLFCAAFYCNEPDRMRVEQELRAVFNPPCGER
jgi:hypothetical protein